MKIKYHASTLQLRCVHHHKTDRNQVGLPVKLLHFLQLYWKFWFKTRFFSKRRRKTIWPL